jgi:pilus assembly protein Flp/PilA
MWVDRPKQIWMLLCSAVTEQDGVTAIEYGLLGALIAVVCVAAFAATGGSLAAVYTAWSAAVVAAL